MAIEVGKNDLKEVVRSLGPQGFLAMLDTSLTEKKMKPEQVSIAELWRACTGDAPISAYTTLEDDFRNIAETVIKEDLNAMGSTLFAKATGALINSKVRGAYDITPGIGDRLVTVLPSKMKNETIVGFTNMDTVDEVDEGGEYPQVGFQELYFTGTNKKYGAIISITEETIKFDQTAQILDRAGRIGERAKLYKEKLIIDGVVGPAINSSTNSIFKPLGTAAVPYSTSARTTLAQGGACGPNGATGHADINHASLQALRTLAMENYGEQGTTDFINLAMQGWIMLTPVELADEAYEVVTTPKTPFSNDNAENFWRQFGFIPVASPFLTTATTWLLGDFKKDFILTEVFPLQIFRLARGGSEEFNRDIVAGFKVRWMGGILQIDSRHSYKCE